MTRLSWDSLPPKYRTLYDDTSAKKKISKYHAKSIEIDGYKFASKKEGQRYLELKLLQKAGKIKFFLRQPMFDLGAGTVHKADFLIFWKDGHFSIEDVKGLHIAESKLKKKLTEDKYPIQIEII